MNSGMSSPAGAEEAVRREEKRPLTLALSRFPIDRDSTLGGREEPDNDAVLISCLEAELKGLFAWSVTIPAASFCLSRNHVKAADKTLAHSNFEPQASSPR